ncbi:MAG: SDR family NAD(P)-dependent oxidoreductase [Dehalococcoidales bacterium]
MRVQGKVALVAGAGTIGPPGGKLGNGRAAAILLAKEGARVVAADISLEAAEETVAKIKDKGGDAIAIQGDVSREADAKRMVEMTLSHYGKLDILDNNVGIYLERDIVDMSVEEWDHMMAVNVKGIFLVSKYAIKAMMNSGGGAIVNLATIWALQPRPGSSAYNTSKAAVIGLTKCMAVEYAPYGIRVNCVIPAVIDTPLFDTVATPEGKKKRIGRIPLGRMGLAEEVAKIVLFFASDDSSYTTGETVLVDGGMFAGYPRFF